MENSEIALQLLTILIAIPCLVIFYWFVLFRVLAFIVRIVKHLWYSTE